MDQENLNTGKDLTGHDNQFVINTSFVLPPDLRIKENAKRCIALRIEHPDWTWKQIGDTVGITASRVSRIINHPKVRAALPFVIKQKAQDFAPNAWKAYQHVVNQTENLQVKEKAAAKILAESKVFDAPTIRVEGEIRLRDVRELEQIVRRAAEMPTDAIEAEVIPPEISPM